MKHLWFRLKLIVVIVIAFIIISMIFGSNNNPIKENNYEERNTNVDGCRIISSI